MPAAIGEIGSRLWLLAFGARPACSDHPPIEGNADGSRCNANLVRSTTAAAGEAVRAVVQPLTFCYLYGDYFGLYKPGKLQHMLDGAGPMGLASQARCCSVALLLVVPGLMAFLSLALPARLARWLCIGLALFYAVFVALTMPGAWWFFT